MSYTSSELDKLSVCANCGKGEEAGINLKACMACKLAKYCSRECQIAHRPQHKKECKRRAKELHDEKLFKQPPPDEDCPICMIRLPSLHTGRTYMECCGKIICNGCIHAPLYDNQGNEVDNEKCPFCRTPTPATHEEYVKRLEKRLELNDSRAMFNLGCYYSRGKRGLLENHAKALELWQRSGELGNAEAYFNVGVAYNRNGIGVERDKTKAIHYWELAALGGDAYARCNLGAIEGNRGNMNRALKHYMIAVKDGDSDSLNKVKSMYMDEHATKEVYAKALRSYQAYLDEIKSDQRDEAAAYRDEYKYYESTL